MDVHVRILFLFIVMVSSEEVKKNLTCTVGGSITLPDPVEENVFLLFGKYVITMVTERKIMIYGEIFKDRVLWNSSSGLFTITRLQRNDSGIYSVQSQTGRVFVSSYKLTVFESVPTPTVDTLNVSSESCTLRCLVEKAEATTLLWYKDEQIVNQSSSARSLPLTVLKQDLSSSYRCVAANPADQKTLAVNLTTSCSENRGHGEPNNVNNGERHYVAGVVIPIVLTIIIILVVLIKCKCSDKNKTTTGHQQDSVSTEADVQYTEVLLTEDGRRKGRHLPDSSGPVKCSNLTTVYDKLEVHRLAPNHTDTDDQVHNSTPD